jgi:hypothetical protein
MATRELTVRIPERVYRRLEDMAQETKQPLETVLLTSITGNLPPSLDDVPVDLRENLRALQGLDDESLWAIARGRLTSLQQERLETLLARSSAGTLTKAEQEELNRSGEETDRLNLRKAQAFALLRWRGFPLPPIDNNNSNQPQQP